MATVGDKIGFEVPTVDGDNNTWGTGLNNFFTKLDEYCYASREDRNLVVMGGGKISWDDSSDELSFTENIEIFNHVTQYKVSVTTAASPISLTAAGDCAYVKINRQPSSNQNITSVTKATIGTLPNQDIDADHGVLVLAYRSEDNTIIFPKFGNKELLDGDHLYLNSLETFYERKAKHGKPSFFNGTIGTTITCEASASVPACVFIEGKVYVNTSDATCDLSTSGRDGLDTGSIAHTQDYYIYAIPESSGRGFDLVASATDPSTGPTGFSNWSYIGSCCTRVGVASFHIFQYHNGTCEILNGETTGETDYEVTSSGGTSQSIQIPVTAKSMHFHAYLDSADATDWAQLGPTSSAYVLVCQTTDSGGRARSYVELPVFESQTVYVKTRDSGVNMRFRIAGWKEDIGAYK